MKRMLMCLLLAGCFASSFATDARVVTMGGNDNFFMDEVSVFRNPANINIYPNMVYGSYGVYRPTATDTGQWAAMARSNRDPMDPFFGAIVSYSLNQDSENRNQYPMLSLGAVFNRQDDMLDYITPGSDRFGGSNRTGATFLPPAGKVDLLAGYVMQNGGMIGIGTYFAVQSETSSGNVINESSMSKVNIGVNWPIAKSTNLEVSVGGGMLNSQGQDSLDNDVVVARDDMFARGDVRLFTALTMINGDFVPHLGVQTVSLNEGNTTFNDVDAGVGINVNIDKGFFWSAVEGLFRDYTYGPSSDELSSSTGIGARVSFGIERSIWWDWFVIRVGGQKVLLYNTETADNIERTRWAENPASDGSDKDLVSLGFGLNVENRLRVDFVAAEDVPYTFTNLVSGPQHHLFTRVSATYSF